MTDDERRIAEIRHAVASYDAGRGGTNNRTSHILHELLVMVERRDARIAELEDNLIRALAVPVIRIGVDAKDNALVDSLLKAARTGKTQPLMATDERDERISKLEAALHVFLYEVNGGGDWMHAKKVAVEALKQ